MSDKWKLIEGRSDRSEMSRIVREDDPEFLIAYVLTDSRNEHARKEDLQRGELLSAAPELLEALKKIDDENGRHFHLDTECACLLRTAIAKAEGRKP